MESDNVHCPLVSQNQNATKIGRIIVYLDSFCTPLGIYDYLIPNQIFEINLNFMYHFFWTPENVPCGTIFLHESILCRIHLTHWCG